MLWQDLTRLVSLSGQSSDPSSLYFLGTRLHCTIRMETISVVSVRVSAASWHCRVRLPLTFIIVTLVHPVIYYDFINQQIIWKRIGNKATCKHLDLYAHQYPATCMRLDLVYTAIQMAARCNNLIQIHWCMSIIMFVLRNRWNDYSHADMNLSLLLKLLYPVTSQCAMTLYITMQMLDIAHIMVIGEVIH